MKRSNPFNKECVVGYLSAMNTEIATHYEIFKEQVVLKQIKLLARMKGKPLTHGDTAKEIYEWSDLSTETYSEFEAEAVLAEVRRLEKSFGVASESEYEDIGPEEAYRRLLKSVAGQ